MTPLIVAAWSSGVIGGSQGGSMGSYRLGRVIFGMMALVPSLAWSANAPESPAAKDPATAPAPEPVYCMSGWERFLPGEYYACRARYHLQRQHPQQAVRMLKEASYWANKAAQHALGLAYVNGDIPGVAADRPLGIAWLALAAERRNSDYLRDYSAAVLGSSASDVSAASRIYLKLRKTYGDRVAGDRATRRFVREVEPLDGAAAVGGNMVYIDGLTPLPKGAFAMSRKIHKEAEKFFEGLQGTVSVGVLERVQAPTPALRERYKADLPHAGVPEK
jgi:TPR repeat protein